jgi:hypothetical protein
MLAVQQRPDDRRRVGSASSFNISAAAMNSSPDGSSTTFAGTKVVCLCVLA